MSLFGHSNLDRGYVCESCLSLNPTPTDKSPCRKCGHGHGPTADEVLAELLKMDQDRDKCIRDKTIQVTFDPLPRKGDMMTKTVGDQTYRIIRLR